MTTFDLIRDRLSNQRIASAPLATAGEVVDWLCAVQAQDYTGAKWALALRTRNATDKDMDQAFADGSILRTHLMRPTWHFVTPADIRWLLALTAPRVHAANGTMYRKLELDQATFQRSNAVLAEALQGGQQLTRDELRVRLETAGIATGDGLRLSYIMMSAELDGVVCSGARRGKQFTYATLAERAPHARILEREEALAELAKRYFVSRGPASVHDFAKWSGLTITDARRGLDAVKAGLEHAQVADQTCWFLPSTAVEPLDEPPDSPAAFLLSIYDEYISSYKDRSAIADSEVGERLMSMGSALSYLILMDGQVAGTWRRTLHKDAVGIETNRFRPFTAAEEQALTAPAQRYRQFIELPVKLV